MGMHSLRTGVFWLALAALGACSGTASTPRTAQPPILRQPQSSETESLPSPPASDVRSATPAATLENQDEAAIRRWFAHRNEGVVDLPAELFVDCQRGTPESFMDFLMHDPGTGERDVLFRLQSFTPMRRVAPDASCITEPGVTHVIQVFTGSPPPTCTSDCEGYEWIEFGFDAEGRIRALHVTAAG